MMDRAATCQQGYPGGEGIFRLMMYETFTTALESEKDHSWPKLRIR